MRKDNYTLPDFRAGESSPAGGGGGGYRDTAMRFTILDIRASKDFL